MSWLAVAIGGAIGSLARYALALWVNVSGWPFGTWLVNIIGSFAIGLLYVIGKERGGFSPEFYLLLTTGVLGGFTTFSTFSLEVVSMLSGGQMWKALAYMVSSVGLGIAAASFGWWIGRNLW